MTLTEQVKEQVAEALDKAEDTRSLLLACKKEGTPEKLTKANMHYTVRLAYLDSIKRLVEPLFKQNREDLKGIIRLENASI